MDHIDATKLVELQREMLAREKQPQDEQAGALVKPSAERTSEAKPHNQYPLAGKRQKYPLER